MTKKYIKEVCKKYNIKNYTINSDMTVDVNDDVYIRYSNLKELPIYFNIVDDNFVCDSQNLNSLKGCPRKVYGGFDASYNKLKDLKYFPEYVEGNVFLDYNDISDLTYLPKKTSLNINLSGNEIRTFKNLFNHTFYVENNPIEPLWDLFKDRNYIDYFNELDIISPDERSIVFDRLNYFLVDIGKGELDILSKNGSLFRTKNNKIYRFENYNIIY